MKKILVIDDDVTVVELLQMMFEEEAFLIQTLTSGARVQQQVVDFQPDLILLDVLLSGVDGRVVARTLKQQVATSRIPIIMLSATRTTEQTSRAAGADAFIAKPFDLEQLLGLVNAYLR